MSFSIGTTETVTVPQEIVDNGARQAIIKIVFEECNVLLPEGDEDFWRWCTPEGKLPKRIQKWVKERTHRENVKPLTTDASGRIGSIGGLSLTEATEYTYDFANRIDWHSGAFGDHGSCYWGSNEAAKEMIEINGGLAIRFFTAEGRGYARAWLYEVEPDLWVVWNGYGLTTVQVARILSHIVGGSYREVSLTNQGTTDEMLYINGISYLVSSDPAKLADASRYVELDWDELYSYRCEGCGCRIESESEDFTSPNDSDYHYCESCYNDLYVTCESCREEVDRDDAEEDNYGDSYCRSCFRETFGVCELCSEPFLLGDLKQDEDGNHFCDACLTPSDEYAICSDCDTVRYLSELQEKGGGYVCADDRDCEYRVEDPESDGQLVLTLNEEGE